MGCELLFDQLLQLGHQCIVATVAGAEDDVRLEDLTGQRIGHAHDHGLSYPFVGAQDTLDVERPVPVSGHDDDVVIAGGEVVVPVVIDTLCVASEVPGTVRRESPAVFSGASG